MTPKKLTKKKTEAARAMHAEGLRAEVIAERLGLTVEQVRDVVAPAARPTPVIATGGERMGVCQATAKLHELLQRGMQANARDVAGGGRGPARRI